MRFWFWGLRKNTEEEDLADENRRLGRLLKKAEKEVESLTVSLDREREESAARLVGNRDNWDSEREERESEKIQQRQKIRELEEQNAVQNVLIEHLNEVVVRDRERVKAETAIAVARQRGLRDANFSNGSLESGDS